MSHDIDLDRWGWWRQALENPKLIGTTLLPVYESDPQVGYYRVKNKTKGWVPVAIFYPENSDSLVAYSDGLQVSDINLLWTWCCRNPVSYEAYENAIAGLGWIDEPKQSAGIGDNSKDADDYERLRIEYLGEKEAADEFLKKPVKTQDDANKCAIWSKRLSDIAKRADEFHSLEKRPHLDAGKAVDNKWRELKDEPKTLSTRLKRHIDAYAAEQRKIEEDRARKAREEEERLRREAAELVGKANEFGAQSFEEQENAVEKAKALQAEADRKAKEAEVQNFQAGRTGAKVSTRTFKTAVITNYDILLMALKDREEVKELVTSLANRAAKSDFKLPGMDIKFEERVV